MDDNDVVMAEEVSKEEGKGFSQEQLVYYIPDKDENTWTGVYEIKQNNIDPETDEWGEPRRARITIKGKKLNEVIADLNRAYFTYMESLAWDLKNDSGSPYLVTEEIQ